VETVAPEVPYRRIGSILVEHGLITQEQLVQALDEQERSGRLLGEILVSSFGVTRVALADALAEQWQEANRTHSGGDVAPTGTDGAGRLTDEDDLRVLLDEAEAARAELEVRTEELSRRLATLEGVVSEVTNALAELRATHDDTGNGRAAGAAPRSSRRRHNGRR
jgi:chaperonin cofactor prefoldin